MKPFYCQCIKTIYRESHNDYDMWIHNKDRKVSPTIDFVDGYPRVSNRNIMMVSAI